MTPEQQATAVSQSQQYLLSDLRRMVLDEALTHRQQIHKGWSQPLPARIAAGRAIESVRIKEINRNGRITCTCSRNNTRFREGDILCLNRSNPFFAPNYLVTLEVDDGKTLILVGDDPGINWGDITAGSDGWVLDEGYLDLSQYVLDALNEAGDSLVGRSRILPLLLGDASPQLNITLYGRGLEMGEALGLNWSQSEALAGAYSSDLLYLIQGPPGTGKTRVLAHLAQALVSDGERVLVTAFTHRATNHALNKIAEIDPNLPVGKIGPPSRNDGLETAAYGNFSETPFRDMAGGYIIGATPFAPHTKRLAGVEFDTVIFDEASQITLPLAIMGMLAAQKYIFIGDPQQMPPVLLTRKHQNALGESVFSQLTIYERVQAMLTITYRLNQELVAWPNRHFYNDQLVPAEHVATRRIYYPRPPQRFTEILDPEIPKIFWEMGQSNTTTHSHREAQAVTDIILTLLDCGFQPGEIGVVAPYRAQGRLIRNLMQQHITTPFIRRQIVVDTVERMQGQERDCIILSLATSNAPFAANLAEFFFQPERLNVAVTRPRHKLIIVGSRQVLQAVPNDNELQTGVALLTDLLNSCTCIPYGL